METPLKTSDDLTPSTLVLDSSAIGAIFFKDKSGQSVTEMIQSYDRLVTVDLAYAEVGSIAWKSVVIFKESIESTSKALEQAITFISDNCDVVSSKYLLMKALKLGIKYKVQIYDALFLVLGKELKTIVLTTDERLHNRLKTQKQLDEMTVLAGENS